jgi:hypothetical protein
MRQVRAWVEPRPQGRAPALVSSPCAARLSGSQAEAEADLDADGGGGAIATAAAGMTGASGVDGRGRGFDED